MCNNSFIVVLTPAVSLFCSSFPFISRNIQHNAGAYGFTLIQVQLGKLYVELYTLMSEAKGDLGRGMAYIAKTDNSIAA